MFFILYEFYFYVFIERNVDIKKFINIYSGFIYSSLNLEISISRCMVM